MIHNLEIVYYKSDVLSKASEIEVNSVFIKKHIKKMKIFTPKEVSNVVRKRNILLTAK